MTLSETYGVDQSESGNSNTNQELGLHEPDALRDRARHQTCCPGAVSPHFLQQQGRRPHPPLPGHALPAASLMLRGRVADGVPTGGQQGQQPWTWASGRAFAHMPGRVCARA